MRTYARKYGLFGPIWPPEIGKPRILTRIQHPVVPKYRYLPSPFRPGFRRPDKYRGIRCGNSGEPLFSLCFRGPVSGWGGGWRSWPPWGPSGSPAGSVIDSRGKTRGIRGRGGPIRVEYAYELGTPHGAVGRTVLPTLSWAFPAGAREAVPRVLGRFHRNPAGFALGTPPGAVGGKFRPSGSWGVRIGLARVRGSILMIFDGFYR